MTMSLVGPYLTTTRYGGKKKRKLPNTASLREATAKHDAWLKKQGLHPEQRELKRAFTGKERMALPDYRVESNYQLSNGIGNGYKQGILANLHKESKEVQQQILDKASRCMPLFNKGGYQYATDDTDMTTVGSKSRRG
jgi:hypothetical protein